MTKVNWWNLNLGINESHSLNNAFSDKLLSYGRLGKELEQKLCLHLNIKHTLLTTSGSTSLLVALKTLNLKPDDEVIVPNRTFHATANAVLLAGAKVILADVDPITGLITNDTINKVISIKTKAIIVVHLNGRSVDLDPIIKLKEKFSFVLIEDTAQAFNSKYKNKFLGTIGDIGCFSLGVTKFITSGQGGFIVTNSLDRYEQMKKYHFHDMQGDEDKSFISFGFNFRQSDLLSSLALSQINNLELKTSAYLNCYIKYKFELAQFDFITLIKSDIENGEIPIWIEILTSKRDELFNYLKMYNIETVKFYPSLHRSTHLFIDSMNFPNSQLFEEQGLILPCGPNIIENQIDFVILKIKDFQKTCI